MVAIRILSDLHLEMPETKSYDTFAITPKAPYLALLGDISWVKNKEQFTEFLIRQLTLFKVVFLLLEDHEAYQPSWADAKSFLRDVEDLARKQQLEDEGLGQIIALNRRHKSSPISSGFSLT
ncbi:hypothetical protein B0T26DRAFT_653618 [Lasiosphaeria miniovina]|uniref:Calcineurin-like phosphoesterase domain-containing protein n=1 Tax=Lasiosphaeria miniovina TaxID=1954250 RepID=A0AA40DS48_9PEZI|nr:uncharacterized protein B0T26DRAFT_653618 [Lasiosphaeria miniovina]KAK0709953.1 hypothetical protein B0T26DRAFT_653618 [Lasiosphaeria miniovina]